MSMISQNTNELQTIIGNIMHGLPAVVSYGDGRVYFLLNELSEEMERYLQDGQAETDELRVFPEEYTKALFKEWRRLGFKCKCGRQPMEYMRKCVTIIYPQASNPKTGITISLIPWFMFPGRRFPIFVHAYSVWYYNKMEHKSMKEAAAVTGEIFRIESFHKSTVCRSVRTMGQLFEDIGIEAPLAGAGLAELSNYDITSRVGELLGTCATMAALEEACGIEAARLPAPVNRSGLISRAFSHIPPDLSEVTEGNTSGKGAPPEVARGPAEGKPAEDRGRPTKKKYRPAFAPSWRLERIRKAFIAECRGIVLAMAVIYHRFLN